MFKLNSQIDVEMLSEKRELKFERNYMTGDIKKQETKPTSVRYPINTFKICIPGRIIAQSSDNRDPTFKKWKREKVKVVSTISGCGWGWV